MLTQEQSATASTPVPELYETLHESPASRFSKVAKLWRKAVNGNAAAQYALGLAHIRGEGVPLRPVEGVKWLRRAAAQGHPGGQLNLGVAYAMGRGVRRNWVQAHMWFNLAAIEGEDRAIDYLIKLAGRMNSDQIADAQRMAREWKPVAQGGHAA